MRLHLHQLQVVAVGVCDENLGQHLRTGVVALRVFAFDFLQPKHIQLAVLHKHVADRNDTATTPEDTGVEVPILLRDTEPAGAPAGYGQSPAADVRIGLAGPRDANKANRHNQRGQRQMNAPAHENHLSS
jgi:hypothetical protein